MKPQTLIGKVEDDDDPISELGFVVSEIPRRLEAVTRDPFIIALAEPRERPCRPAPPRRLRPRRSSALAV